jgi:hypothetical protein
MMAKNGATSHTLSDTKTSPFIGINPLLERNGASLTLVAQQPDRAVTQIDSKGMDQLKRILNEKKQAVSSKK